MVQDIKYNPGALSGLGRYGKGHVYMHVLQGWAVQNVTSWQIWKGARVHACSAGLGRAKRDQSQEMGQENTNKYRPPHPLPAHAC